MNLSNKQKSLILLGTGLIVLGIFMRKQIVEVFDIMKIKELIKKYTGIPVTNLPEADKPPVFIVAWPNLTKKAQDMFSTIPVNKFWGIESLYLLPVDTLRQKNIASIANTKQEFVNIIKQPIINAAMKYGFSNPQIAGKWIASQVALESGWGKNAIGGWNLGGHIATSVWTKSGGKYTLATTWEDVKGIKTPTIRAFKAFNSLNEFLDSHIKLITGNFYKTQYATSMDDFAKRLATGGYATDSNYVTKLNNTYTTLINFW